MSVQGGVTHAAGCRGAGCQGCVRAGEGKHGIDSPAHALALDQARSERLGELEAENRLLRGKVAQLERDKSNLELKLRGVPVR